MSYAVSQKKSSEKVTHPYRDVAANPQVCPTFLEDFF
jgi:hypothetical protein